MLTTTNYKFKKPELTDSPPDITVMNGTGILSIRI